MASAFGHAFAAIAMGSTFKKYLLDWKFWVLGIICSIIPDADVVSFSLGIPYESFWGHRGFTHSFVFAFLLAMLLTFLFYKKADLKTQIWLTFYFFLCTASHSILDALTSGGLGVAFFSPFNDTRYFLPWRPIKVSPIGIENFMSEWGLRVIKSELIWIGIPGFALIFISKIIKRLTSKSVD